VHKASGLVFQGSSADCMKVKMISMHKMAKENGSQMLLSVHDELKLPTPNEKVKKFSKIVEEGLETFDGVNCEIKCGVPILSSVVFADNWWTASK